MRMTLRELRSLVLEALEESDSNGTYPYIHDVVAPATNNREEIGSLADDPNKDPEDQLSPHLRQPNEEPEDVRGPIPAVDDQVYALSDPYASDYHAIPKPNSAR
jgi:hypothetical protein